MEAQGQVVDVDVAVIGAGLAGLMAAREVVAAGLTVRVFEARERVGGRLWNVDLSLASPGTSCDALMMAASSKDCKDSLHVPNELGGQWVAPYHTTVHALCSQLCIALFHAHRLGDHVYIAANGVAKRYNGDLPLPPQTAAAVTLALSELEKIVAGIDPAAPWLHHSAKALDSQSFEEWLTRHVSDSDAADIVRCNAPASTAYTYMHTYTHVHTCTYIHTHFRSPSLRLMPPPLPPPSLPRHQVS